MALQSWEIAAIILVIVVLFGASAIPRLARNLGRAKGEFVKAKKEFDREAGLAEAKPDEMEEKIRRTARDLGVPEEGRDLADVKKDINEKLG